MRLYEQPRYIDTTPYHFMLSSKMPVPIATQLSGLSDTKTGTFNSSASRWSMPWIKAPPPVKKIPRSIISAESSGGVLSSTLFAALTINRPTRPKLSQFQPQLL